MADSWRRFFSRKWSAPMLTAHDLAELDQSDFLPMLTYHSVSGNALLQVGPTGNTNWHLKESGLTIGCSISNAQSIRCLYII